MPQFDSSFFLSQVFWLAICFAALYFSMSKIYLPRISNILKERKKNIEHNSLISQELNRKILEINQTSEISRNNSSMQYQIAMDQAMKEASLRREQALNDLRKKTDIMSHHSEEQINNFIENSKNNSASIITNLVNILSKKIFSDQPQSGSTSIKHFNE
jgi:F-type H+-transporting ATPase subunit b